MALERGKWRNALVRAGLLALMAGGASACAEAGKLNPLALGRIEPSSPVAADIETARRTPGPYPSFSRIPPAPTDVRPARAWRAAAYDAWGLKRRTEAEAAAIPFVLTVGEAEAWAEVERAKIPAAEMAAPTADASDQSEAFAAAERARATPPPPPK